MRPYGRIKKILKNYKNHNIVIKNRKWGNWWEDFNTTLSRSRVNQLIQKEIEQEINQNMRLKKYTLIDKHQNLVGLLLWDENKAQDEDKCYGIKVVNGLMIVYPNDEADFVCIHLFCIEDCIGLVDERYTGYVEIDPDNDDQLKGWVEIAKNLYKPLEGGIKAVIENNWKEFK